MAEIIGTAGNDALNGTSGDDDFYGLGGNDTINGGDGYDVAWFNRSTVPVRVDLAAGTASGEGNDVLINIEGVTGTSFSDILLGNEIGNYFRADGGGDTIDGRGGIDEVEYRRDPAGVFIDLSRGTARNSSGSTDTLISIERATGSAFADILIGDAGANRLRGQAGRDQLVGGAGNDELDGGTEIDTAVYSAARSQYTITRGGAGTFTVSGPDGTDTLSSIERLKFADGTLCFDSGDVAAQAFRLYRAALGRTPDSEGLGFHTGNLDRGVSLEVVSGGFISSPEFQAKYGNLSTGDFVERLYQNVLGRGSDAEGFAHWTGVMNRGISKEVVLIHFSESAENKANVAPLINDGFWFT